MQLAVPQLRSSVSVTFKNCQHAAALRLNSLLENKSIALLQSSRYDPLRNSNYPNCSNPPKMKRWFFLLLFVALSSWKPAIKPPLSAESRLVRAAYLALKAKPTGAPAQLGYLKAFPKSRTVFLRIFMDEPNYGQLYPECKGYIDALQRLGAMYPTQVLATCFNIEKGMDRTSDAVEFIADATVELGIAHPQIFADEAKQFAAADQVALCRFLADEEGIEDDKEYEQLMKQLGHSGATELAAKLQQAKVRRMKQPNH